MSPRSKKAIVATEWSWLLIGTAAVYVHMMETWATPFLPMLWMSGVLALFVGYRFAMALRDHYAPEPVVDLDLEADESGPIRYDREGAKGMLSTTDWVPPHIRGRRKREQAAAKAAGKAVGKIEIPSASGKFDGDEIATVFAEVDEETDPLATHIVDLRPETEADITDGEIAIPSFAESTMTIRERENALRTLDRPAPEAPIVEARVGARVEARVEDADKTLEREMTTEFDNDDEGLGEADKTHELTATVEAADKTLEREAE